MSTCYQILFTNRHKVPDPELLYRFSNKRVIKGREQSEWMYCIFKKSMNARTSATGFMTLIFSLFSVYQYQMFIENNDSYLVEIN